MLTLKITDAQKSLILNLSAQIEDHEQREREKNKPAQIVELEDIPF